VLGVVSDFTANNKSLSEEVLNLVARTNQQYRVIPKATLSAGAFAGLRGVLYPDEQPPAPEPGRQILSFVQSGGMLITGPKWNPAGTPAKNEEHPRFDIRAVGKGRVAVAKTALKDPYVLAGDASTLISHRYDLLRFWNCGAVGSFLTATPDGTHALAQLLFYANRGTDEASIRVTGPYRTARLWTLDHPEPRAVTVERQKDALEIHLPPCSVYAAVEVEA
jgi:hypothetical protein